MAALVSRTAFGGALVLDAGRWCWADTLEPELAAQSVPLAGYLPPAIRSSRYRRAVVLIFEDAVRALDDTARQAVRAVLQEHGRYALLALPSLDRARSRLRPSWTVPEAAWRAAAALPYAVAIAQEHALRVLQRTERWQQANADAERVEAMLDSIRRRVLARWSIYLPHETRAWCIALEQIGAHVGFGTTAWHQAEPIAWGALHGDLLLLHDYEIAQVAERIVNR